MLQSVSTGAMASCKSTTAGLTFMFLIAAIARAPHHHGPSLPGSPVGELRGPLCAPLPRPRLEVETRDNHPITEHDIPIADVLPGERFRHNVACRPGPASLRTLRSAPLDRRPLWRAGAGGSLQLFLYRPRRRRPLLTADGNVAIPGCVPAMTSSHGRFVVQPPTMCARNWVASPSSPRIGRNRSDAEPKTDANNALPDPSHVFTPEKLSATP